jgi:hypothetical protein
MLKEALLGRGSAAGLPGGLWAGFWENFSDEQGVV